MRRIFISVLLCCLCAISRIAYPAQSDCVLLQPVRSPFESDGDLDYESALTKTLFGGETLVRQLQMVRVSGDGRQPEEAAYFVNAKDGYPTATPEYFLVSVRALQNVGLAIQQNPTAVVQRDVVRVPVDQELFERTRSLWRVMVSSARFPTQISALAGTDYYFTVDLGSLFGTALAEGPKPNTCARRLASIGENLGTYARADAALRPALRRQLLEDIRQLQGKLKERIKKANGS